MSLIWWNGSFHEETDDEPPAEFWLMLLFNSNRPCEVCGGPSAVSPAARCWRHRHIGTKSMLQMLAGATDD